jgi:predicted RNA-binding protein with PIN domain
VPDQALQDALELAVGIAAAGVKLRPPLAFPPALKRFLRFHKLPPAALSQVRAAVEADDGFRRRLASVATADLVDQVGMLWLTRPDGWSDAIVALLPQRAEVDDETVLRRERRRRGAAEDSAARAHAEVLVLTGEVERERAAKAMLAAEGDHVRAELDDVRRRLREAQRAEHATAQALAKVEAELAEVRMAMPAPQPDPIVAPDPIDADAVLALLDDAIAASADVARILTAARREVEQPDGPSPAPPRSRRARRRTPLRLPGGVLAGSIESAEYLLRAPRAKVLIDGYNVAKLGWPSLDLDHQRDQCIVSTENLAKRWNIEMTIVFDGATVEGAHASTRRRVRIVYSPAGVSADDVLRAEVEGIGRDQPVVVVTNDREIITDVVAGGSNSLSSDAFLGVLRR